MFRGEGVNLLLPHASTKGNIGMWVYSFGL